jgi:hypothetical protein
LSTTKFKSKLFSWKVEISFAFTLEKTKSFSFSTSISKNPILFSIEKFFATFGWISQIRPISCHLTIIFAVLQE